MADIAELLESILSLILQAIDVGFNKLFSWLPDDPFINTINNIQGVIGSAGQGIHWLAWLIDFNFFAGCLFVIVSALLAWSAYKVSIHVFNTIAKAIELIPFE